MFDCKAPCEVPSFCFDQSWLPEPNWIIIIAAGAHLLHYLIVAIRFQYQVRRLQAYRERGCDYDQEIRIAVAYCVASVSAARLRFVLAVLVLATSLVVLSLSMSVFDGDLLPCGVNPRDPSIDAFFSEYCSVSVQSLQYVTPRGGGFPEVKPSSGYRWASIVGIVLFALTTFAGDLLQYATDAVVTAATPPWLETGCFGTKITVLIAIACFAIKAAAAASVSLLDGVDYSVPCFQSPNFAQQSLMAEMGMILATAPLWLPLAFSFFILFRRECTLKGVFRFSLVCWLVGGVALEAAYFIIEAQHHNAPAKFSMAAMMSLFPMGCRVVRLGVNAATSALGACWLKSCGSCVIRVVSSDSAPPSVPIGRKLLDLLGIPYHSVNAEYEALN